MQLTLVYTVLATLALREVSAIALPEPQPQPSQKYKIADSELGPVYSNVDPNHRRDVDLSLSKRTSEPPQKYKIADSELGPVYSTVDPNHRRDVDLSLSKRTSEPPQKYKIADSELGPVYSTVDPNHRRDTDHGLSERSEAYTPLEPEETSKYMKENGLHPAGQPAAGQVNKRTDAPLEKRDWASCVACMAACGLMQQGISLLSVAQQVQFCLGNCVLQGACSTYFRAEYQDYYGNTFPPPPAPAGH